MPSSEIENLVKALSKIPGFGKRSAKRAVLHLMQKKESMLEPLIDALNIAHQTVQKCSKCGNIDSSNPCYVCESPKRDISQICVVETVSDLWAIERSEIFKGIYHVLGGTLSAINGLGPDDLNIDRLIKKVADGDVKEIILATNATVEGQTTAHYVTQRLQKFKNLKISQLAHGIPIGGELDYLDDGTLIAALNARS